MCRSLLSHCPSAIIFVLALDDYCYDFLVELGDAGIVPIKLQELELFDKELSECKLSRTRAEYIFTMTPCLPRYLLLTHPEINLITYLDADLFFFSSPEPIFAELSAGEVAIIPHRFSKNLRHLSASRGIFNVSWVSFSNRAEGRKCLEWYRERCLEWCFDRVEDGKFADQKYLEHFSEIAVGVVVIGNRGANLAPWNLGNGGLELSGGEIKIDGTPLIFFHYQGLKRCLGSFYDCGLFGFRVRLPNTFRQAIFCRYIQAVVAAKREHLLDLPEFGYGARYQSRFPILNRFGKIIFELVKIVMGYCVNCQTSSDINSYNKNLMIRW